MEHKTVHHDRRQKEFDLGRFIMAGLANLYGFIDTFGASLGIFTNFLLIVAIFKSSGRNKIQPFSYMVLVSAIFDTFFCIIEVLTQHQILVRRGVLFLMPHGIESVLPEWSYYAFMLPHVFSCTMAVVIRGPQYKFRYDLISGKVTDPKWHLAKYVLIAMCVALFTGSSAALGIYQAKQRGMQYYLDQFDGPTFNENVKKSFLYACDIRDIGTIGFYGGGLVFTTLCFWICVYYVWKTQKFIASRNEEASERTKALQRQFTMSLIAQSLNAILFAIIPVSMVCFSMIFRLDAEFIGMATLVPLSYLSSANALLTLLIVKSYRGFLKSLLWGRSSNKVNQSGENQSVDKKALTSRNTVSQTQPTSTPPK